MTSTASPVAALLAEEAKVEGLGLVPEGSGCQEGSEGGGEEVNQPYLSATRGSPGIEWLHFGVLISKSRGGQDVTVNLGLRSSGTKVESTESNKVDTGPKPAVRVRKALQRKTCERSTIEAIYEHVPEAKNDKVLYRWIVYCLWTTWRDNTTRHRVIHHEILHWIGAHRFRSAEGVLEYVADRLPIDCSDTWSPGSHTRQILDDGLPGELWKKVKSDLDTAPSEYDTRVYVLSGRVCTQKDPAKMRKELEEEISGMTPPSPTAHRIWRQMNELPSNRFSRFQDKIATALEYVDRMEIDVSISPLQKARLRCYTGCEKDDDTGELSGNVVRYKARVRHEKRKLAEEQRAKYKELLHDIARQHKPFYGFSRKERTDRIFSHNNSALLLPSEVRSILCESLYDVDLKSAHLLIAAWLWDAHGALKTLTQDGYCIWGDMMEHGRSLFEERGLEVPEKGTDLYDEVKAGMKVMVYSTVYGMPASSIQAEVTKSLQHVLGPDVGACLRSHPVVSEIMEKRDEKLQALEPGDVLDAPSGIDIEVEVGLENEGEKGYKHLVGPKSAVATQAQAYEQELMSVLLDVADERPRFDLMLWLHDGAVCEARHPNAVKRDVNEALHAKREELTEFAGKDTLIPALFKVEKIEAPEMPPKNVDDRVANAGGGAVRLKDGESAVMVDSETGEEVGQAGNLLLKHEHELYRVAGAYIRVCSDGYETVSDPFPEDELWQTSGDSEDSSIGEEFVEQKWMSDLTITCRVVTGVNVLSKVAESSPTSCTLVRDADKQLTDAVQAHLEKQKRLSEGDLPADPREAVRQGFSIRAWLGEQSGRSHSSAPSSPRSPRQGASSGAGSPRSGDDRSPHCETTRHLARSFKAPRPPD
ncbi:MAG: hypothetical protein ABEL97_03240 [Salinibacter sp.]